jgi:hypothetical protein
MLCAADSMVTWFSGQVHAPSSRATAWAATVTALVAAPTRRKYATGYAGLAWLVRGSSRRIMIMRFRPANIGLINRRHYLPRLLLTLSSFEKNDQRILTGQYISLPTCRPPDVRKEPARRVIAGCGTRGV